MVDPTETRLIYLGYVPSRYTNRIQVWDWNVNNKLSNVVGKNQGIKQIKQFPNPKYQADTFSSNDCFKTNNWSFTTLFQGEVKYLNLTNYHFCDLDLLRFIKHAIIKFVISQLVWLSQDSTQSSQILGF